MRAIIKGETIIKGTKEFFNKLQILRQDSNCNRYNSTIIKDGNNYILKALIPISSNKLIRIDPNILNDIVELGTKNKISLVPRDENFHFIKQCWEA
jgi:hypothetical protein